MTPSSLAPLTAWGIVVAKASLLLAFGWCVTRLLRRAPAGARHLAWLTVIVGALCAPVVDRLVPVRVPVLPSVSAASAAPTALPMAIPSHARTPATIDPAAASVHPSIDRPAPHRSIDVARTLGVVWAIGALALLARLLIGVVTVERLIRRSRMLRSADWTNVLANAAQRLGLRTTPRLVMSDQVEMAFAFNVVTPAIIVPVSAAEWSADRRRTVLLHELAHIRRRDLIGHSVAGVACVVYWFNPFMWRAARQLRIESELASDEIVLGTGVRPSEYAQHLLDMVTSFGRRAPAVAVAMARPKEFEGRLVAILDPLRRRSTYARSQRGAVVALLALLAVAIGAAVPVPRARGGGVSGANIRPVGAAMPITHTDSVTVQSGPEITAERHVPAKPPESVLSTTAVASLLRYGTSGIINPMIMVLREADSLQLTGPQADSIATLNRRFMVRLNAIWAPVSAYYLARASGVQSSLIPPEVAAAPPATIDALLDVVPAVDELLTADQRSRLSPLTASYLDAANLAATMNAPDGVFVPIDQLYRLRGRGRSGGGG